MQEAAPSLSFSPYQKFVIAIISLLQFTVVLDFMVMSPLGDLLIKSLDISPAQFGIIVSSYAFSAGISGILAAGFADRFDRKNLLMFFYVGFLAGTLLCGISHTYEVLLAGRIVTGLFGGVIGAISMAVITDIFDLQHRGRVMGFVQMSFAASQVLGIPISILIANDWGWNAPFLMILVFAAILGAVILVKMKPVDQHLALQESKNALPHLWNTLIKKKYQTGFITTALLSIGGFMMMPFGSAFAVNNLKITQGELPIVFMATGLASIVIMPVIGRLSDRIEKLKIFIAGSIWAIITVLIYTNLGALPLWLVIVTNILLFAGIMSRIVPATALVSAIPEMKDRGAFMSVNSSLQQMAGGVASITAGFIVIQQTKTSPLENFDVLGVVVALFIAATVYALYRVHNIVKAQEKRQA